MSWDYERVKVDGEWKLKHRYLMERQLGRELKTKEVVHHKNADPKDNRIENLELMSNREHGNKHGEKRKRRVTLVCDNCGKEFKRKRNQRPENKGYDHTFCSRECMGEYTAKHFQ